jgi:hypothetical protein
VSFQFKARNGDALCGIAIASGFINCARLRAEPANAALLNRPLVDGDIVTVPDVEPKDVSKPTDQLHNFTKKNAPPVSIRFVHGSPDKKYLEDLSLDVLNVSNFPTNKGGNNLKANFPSGFGFNPDGHADLDAFKVEVVDPGASGSVNTTLEALKPVKQPDGSVQFQSFTGAPDAAIRKIDTLSCKQVSSGHVAFRSKYMRLVVDKEDHDAANGQTLLTTDLVDAGDEAHEILEQHVRAAYEFSRCPASPKCIARREVAVGESPQRVKVAIHILQDPATNNPVATIDQARKSTLKFVRQLYAQASMSVKIIDAIRTVPAPTNLIAVADGNGAKAIGGGAIQIRVQVGKPNTATFDFDQTINVTTTKDDLPLATAQAIAAAINKAFTDASFAAKAKDSDNPPLTGQTIQTADVLVGDPLTQRVSLSVVTSGDAGHPITIGRILNTTIVDFGANDAHVGTIQERTLVKNYDSGSDRADLFIVGQLKGALGEAFTPNTNAAANGQPNAIMVNSALVFAKTVTAANDHHTTIPHELGHLLMDHNHAIPTTEMMTNGSPVGKNERVVNGPKRIDDPQPPRTAIGFDDPFSGNPVTELRNRNANIVTGF